MIIIIISLDHFPSVLSPPLPFSPLSVPSPLALDYFYFSFQFYPFSFLLPFFPCCLILGFQVPSPFPFPSIPITLSLSFFSPPVLQSPWPLSPDIIIILSHSGLSAHTIPFSLFPPPKGQRLISEGEIFY
ncbi:hypothetical protein BO85DRAFT_271623 [Aspergillus piperis CBS 112811]|uniref:Uncharacterized protein n=1 Tax=Aspergillus piperis CBS 112811 TaxID=1448313 RepID=A0A8G1R355_9EURO|nr:hypothetical protein BO85DRAFT_271623 [Aspergillus piperis CBS 112811]RAH58307.1 hypothetical protein BO85DRAFT_271623 [Aspergillus piperis CBS 112811]